LLGFLNDSSSLYEELDFATITIITKTMAILKRRKKTQLCMKDQKKTGKYIHVF